MPLLYELFPVLLFFIAFKFYGIYVATVVGIVVTGLQALISRVWKKQWDKRQLITFAVFVLFGGMTLYFHDPIFVKWKPTIVFWIFSLLILFTHFFTQKPLMQRLMENMLQEKVAVPLHAWRKLNLMWACFFVILGTVNLYIAYNFSNNAWVNFKLYGILGALLLISILQAIYLTRYLSESKIEE